MCMMTATFCSYQDIKDRNTDEDNDFILQDVSMDIKGCLNDSSMDVLA